MRWWKPNIGHNSNSTPGGVELTWSGDRGGSWVGAWQKEEWGWGNNSCEYIFIGLSILLRKVILQKIRYGKILKIYNLNETKGNRRIVRV